MLDDLKVAQYLALGAVAAGLFIGVLLIAAIDGMTY